MACATAFAVTACAAVSPDSPTTGTEMETMAGKVGVAQHGAYASPAAMDKSPKTQRPAEPSHFAVSAITIDSHSGFDRLVVDFEGTGEPGWFVNYVSAPLQETAGKPIKVAGSSYLNINIDGTISRPEAGLDATTPIDISASSSNVVDVVYAGTYEGRTQIVVGLRSTLPYSVQLLDDPTRLVVDISTS
ncbi:AMIN domain-containing protein [Corynebacterium sanguinis]|uniref:AMIN domain-containing protein n=1 Tax=Corynebacterium sanguinis TaxID=2594913 RepID=UPI00223AE669|nr:AMIN domain-containing protein [Corynebacterium sanguinis]MCT1413831.1 AMIN domain-containing protein [Corynebacterium sanguinis]